MTKERKTKNIHLLIKRDASFTVFDDVPLSPSNSKKQLQKACRVLDNEVKTLQHFSDRHLRSKQNTIRDPSTVSVERERVSSSISQGSAVSPHTTNKSPDTKNNSSNADLIEVNSWKDLRLQTFQAREEEATTGNVSTIAKICKCLSCSNADSKAVSTLVKKKSSFGFAYLKPGLNSDNAHLSRYNVTADISTPVNILAEEHDKETKQRALAEAKRSGWVSVTDVISSEEARMFQEKIDKELSSVDFMKKYMKQAKLVKSEGVDTSVSVIYKGMKDPKAIFVLGPSASGKTFSTKVALAKIEEDNKWIAFDKKEGTCTIGFITIDGGLVRELSTIWSEMRQLAWSNGNAGFSDLFDTYFQKPIAKFKEKIYRKLLEERANIVIPDTCVSDAFHIGSKPSKRVRRMIDLRDMGYEVALFAVYCSRDTCEHNGKSREKSEGKLYSPIGWSWATLMIEQLFLAHRNHGMRTVNRIVDCTHWYKKEGDPDKIKQAPPRSVGPNECLLLRFLDGKLMYGIDSERASLTVTDWESPNDSSKVFDASEILGF
eukprot:g3032.t1